MSTSETGRLLSVGALVVLFSACSTASPQARFEASSGFTASPAARVPSSSVPVLTAAPQATYETLGSITLEWKGKRDDAAVLRIVREKAAEVGANALLFVDSLGYDSSKFEPNWDNPPDAGAVSATRYVRRTYTFRALRIPPPTES